MSQSRLVFLKLEFHSIDLYIFIGVHVRIIVEVTGVLKVDEVLLAVLQLLFQLFRHKAIFGYNFLVSTILNQLHYV